MSLIPFTIDGREIPADAPRSQGMSDTTALAISDAAEDYRSVVMHLHADVVGRDVTLTGANCSEGIVIFSFGDGAFDVEERVDQGATPEVTHTYPSDGVFTATLRHENGDRSQLDVAVNWPE